MGNVVPSAARVGSNADAESNWDHLPSGTKQLFLKYHENLHFMNAFVQSTGVASRVHGTDEVMFSSPEERVRDGLDVVLNFVILSSRLFVADRDYSWNLWRSQMSACVLAADFLIQKNDRGALLMTFYVALVREYLSRGPEAVNGCWVVKGGSGSATANAAGDTSIVRLRDELLFSDLAHLHRAVANTRSRRAMAVSLSKMLGKYSGDANRWARRMDDIARRDRSSSVPIHSFGTFGAVPEASRKIKCIVGNGPAAFVEMEVYRDTSLEWVFRHCISFAPAGRSPLNDARRGGAGSNLGKDFPGLCLRSLDAAGSVFYLKTHGERRIRELAIEDGDAFQLLLGARTGVAERRNDQPKQRIELPFLSMLVCCSVPNLEPSPPCDQAQSRMEILEASHSAFGRAKNGAANDSAGGSNDVDGDAGASDSGNSRDCSAFGESATEITAKAANPPPSSHDLQHQRSPLATLVFGHP